MIDAYKAPEAKLTSDPVAGEYGSIENGLAGRYQFSIKEICSEAWTLVKGAKLSFLIATIVYFVVYFVIAFAVNMILAAVGFSMPSMFAAEAGLGSGIGQLIQGILVTLLVTPLGVGLFMLGIRRSVGKSLPTGELFAHYGKMVPLFVVTVLVYLFMLIGFLLLILPGIYLAIGYSMALPLVVDQGLSPTQAMKTSRKTIHKKWFAYFGLILVMMLAMIIGFLALGIGLFWAGPFCLIAYGIAYRNMFGVGNAATDA